MRTAVISDIHANLQAWRGMLRDLREAGVEADSLKFLGGLPLAIRGGGVLFTHAEAVDPARFQYIEDAATSSIRDRGADPSPAGLRRPWSLGMDARRNAGGEVTGPAIRGRAGAFSILGRRVATAAREDWMKLFKRQWIVAGLCLVAVGLVQAQAPAGASGDPPGVRGDRPFDPFKQFDRNGDGKLTKDEMPPRMVEQLFGRIDRDGDGAITREEDEAFRRSRPAQAGGPQAGPGRDRPPSAPPVKPDLADVKYGPHERNVFDLWKAKGEGPRPLVIFYHGGGFRGGDKGHVNGRMLEGLLAKGVSVAAANYRLTDTAPYPAQMNDSARALQFIRLHAAEYGIDPKRIGATGGSAGAGISQWLLMHNDLADPKNADPVLRQSSRVQCAVATAAQSSYDPRVHQAMFNATGVEGAMFPFYGMASAEDIKNPKFHPLFEDASPITHATKDDGPLMLYYPQANDPLPENPPGNLYIHHPKFGFMMKEKLDKLGVECVLKLKEDYDKPAADGRRADPTGDTLKFFAEKLKP